MFVSKKILAISTLALVALNMVAAEDSISAAPSKKASKGPQILSTPTFTWFENYSLNWKIDALVGKPGKQSLSSTLIKNGFFGVDSVDNLVQMNVQLAVFNIAGNWNASTGGSAFLIPALGKANQCQGADYNALKIDLATASDTFQSNILAKLSGATATSPSWDSKNYYWVAENVQLIPGVTGDVYVDATNGQIRYFAGSVTLTPILNWLGITTDDLPTGILTAVQKELPAVSVLDFGAGITSTTWTNVNDFKFINPFCQYGGSR